MSIASGTSFVRTFFIVVLNILLRIIIPKSIYKRKKRDYSYPPYTHGTLQFTPSALRTSGTSKSGSLRYILDSPELISYRYLPVLCQTKKRLSITLCCVTIKKLTLALSKANVWVFRLHSWLWPSLVKRDSFTEDIIDWTIQLLTVEELSKHDTRRSPVTTT